MNEGNSLLWIKLRTMRSGSTQMLLSLAIYENACEFGGFGFVAAASFLSIDMSGSTTLKDLCHSLRTNDPSITELSIQIDDRSRVNALLKALQETCTLCRSRWT
jgi:hypothetical protein